MGRPQGPFQPWTLLLFLAVSLLAPAGSLAHGPCGALCGPVRAGDGSARLERQPYVPRAGDLVVYSDESVFWRFVFALAWTGPPYHCGIVVDLPNGEPAVLEAGAYDRNTITVKYLYPRFRTHQGTLWVRRLRCPLTAEQSARLTTFALDQTTKKYALARVCLEITPFRAHGPLHSRIFGSSSVNRSRWYCSDLTMAAAAVAGLIDPRAIKPNAIYPRDIYRDRPYDLSPWWEGPALWSDECDR